MMEDAVAERVIDFPVANRGQGIGIVDAEFEVGRQAQPPAVIDGGRADVDARVPALEVVQGKRAASLEASEFQHPAMPCLLYTSDAADERSSVDLGGRRIIKKK